MQKRFSNKAVGALVMALVAFSVVFGGQISSFLRTSVIGYPEHASFDGTVAPIKKVPNWSGLTSAKYNSSYNDLSSGDFVDLPKYDPSQLSIDSSTLKWGNVEHNNIRNAKITYSVPYLGNYKLDGKEYGGSHAAIDIKIPTGTPIFAMANGTVTKVANQSGGFGLHVVLQHNNFPTLENSKAKETIYSSYSHLSEILVEEGDVVKKGDQIALSGKTGLATTPHLHFQIDNSNAPWHPFWPFSTAEINAAGLDFFGAINAGFNQDKAKTTTINPMKYVQAYKNGSSSNTSSDSSNNTSNNSNNQTGSYVPDDEDDDQEVEEEDEQPPVIEEEDEPEVVEEEPVVEPSEPPVLQFDFEVKDKYFVGQNSEFSILMRDQYGEVYKEGFSGELNVKSVDGSVTASAAIFSLINFDNDGEMQNSFRRMSAGRDRLVIEYNGNNYYSDWFEIEKLDTAARFNDVAASDPYFNSIIELADEGVVAGYPDGSFKPNKVVNRVEALKFIFEGIKENTETGDIPFPDVSEKDWYSRYLHTAYEKGVVDGYPDGTFKPTNTVNKAEFYKILFNGMGVDVNPNVTSSPFKDVDVNDWYAPYVIYARELEIINPDVKYLNASSGMTRAEVADAIYRLRQVK